MTVRRYEEITCDRCKEVFEKHGRTMEIGWFKLTNGSGSKLSTDDRRRDNLDYDLCQMCTELFEDFWRGDL